MEQMTRAATCGLQRQVSFWRHAPSYTRSSSGSGQVPRHAARGDMLLESWMEEVERETGIEPATFCLGSRYSAN